MRLQQMMPIRAQTGKAPLPSFSVLGFSMSLLQKQENHKNLSEQGCCRFPIGRTRIAQNRLRLNRNPPLPVLPLPLTEHLVLSARRAIACGGQEEE